MRFEFLKNFPMGLFLGMLVATVSYLFLDDNYLGEWGKHFAYSISAATTLAGAGLALASVFHNIDTQQKIEQNRRRQSFLAARSTLPLALSQLGSLSARGMEICLAINCGSRSFLDLAQDLEVSPDLISTITRVIEFGDEDSGECLGRIVRRHQMMVSRFERWQSPHRIPSDTDRSKEAVNWAVQYQLIGEAFEFARGESEKIPKELANRNLASVFWINFALVLDPSVHPDLCSAAAEFEASNDLELL